MANSNLTTRIAVSLIEEHGLTVESVYLRIEPTNVSLAEIDLATGAGSSKRVLVMFDFDVDLVFPLIKRRVRRLRPGTLGIIACEARSGSELYSMHCGTWLSKYDDGRSLLRDIVATAIAVEIRRLLPEPAKQLAA